MWSKDDSNRGVRIIVPRSKDYSNSSKDYSNGSKYYSNGK